MTVMQRGGHGSLKFKGFYPLFRQFSRQFHQIFKKSSSGYIFILMCTLTPVLLLAVKYCVDIVSYNHKQIYTGGNDFYKKCAKEAALAVAKKWNPGLTLNQQKESLLLIADDIYNKNPCYCNTPAHNAIPGLEVRNVSKTSHGMYDPFRLIWSDTGFDSANKIIEYIDAQEECSIDINVASDLLVLLYNVIQCVRLSHFAINDVVWDVSVDDNNFPKRTCFKAVGSGIAGDSNGGKTQYAYTKRKNKDDNTVQISVEDDKIRVQTDNDIGYAVPAECNVDIVLSIPTNSAANVAGGALPQIAKAYRKFLADNFEFTRGINVGLIPYSGKISIFPDRSGWSSTISAFTWSSDDVPRTCRGCFLYGSNGVQNGALTTSYNNWGSFKIRNNGGGGFAIMCREDLLSTEAPEQKDTFFRKTNDRPCIAEHANFLSMKCEQNCNRYYHNPFFIVELIADVGKMRDFLNCVVPFYDNNNESNFLFIPITWANNLFQSWTNDPQCEKVNTVRSLTGGQLSRPSKMTRKRKKALILVVNKPDWFEPNELTYLGFSDDFKEISKIATETIDFSTDFGSGAIQSAKGILKYQTTSGNVGYNTTSGLYETTTKNQTCTAKLSFPNKYLVKTTVDRTTCIAWSNIGKVLNNVSGQSDWRQIAYNGNIWMALSESGYIAVSTDAVTWTSYGRVLTTASDWFSIAYGNNVWMAITPAKVSISHDGTSWIPKTNLDSVGFNGWNDIQYGDGTWFATNHWGRTGLSTDNGDKWSFLSDSPLVACEWYATYYKGQWITLSEGGRTELFEYGNIWTHINFNLAKIKSQGWVRIFGSDECCMALNLSGDTAISVDCNSWEALDKLSASSDWKGLGYGNGKFVACNYDGTIAITSTKDGVLRFTNITSSSEQIASSQYEISEKKDFYIEPSQISNTKDTDDNYYIEFDMTNIRLISAEITNKPYTINNGVVTFTEEALSTINANLVLLGGIGSEDNSEVGWYDGTDGTASEAVANVTKQACAKLKTDWGEDIKIYVIKYRKQGVNADYNYIDSCATTGRVYDVSDEAGLNSTLQTIANDIKSWAG
ncbi:MAG: hypothetical protein LBB21_06210, partial [Holosporaceae bacterium]|nr:hypothetical protein [Holosporaceae bacterium]